MLYIDGEWRGASSGTSFEVFNPATGEVIGDVADGNRDDAACAIQAASVAFTGWSRFTAYQRAAYLLRAYTRENRIKVWEDLKAARARVDESP
mgnify:CR=1 FL=1